MKRGTPRHRKMRKLAELLKIELAHAVGIMEMIWHGAGQETPRGDIGAAKDREIAAWCDWTKKPSVLVDALVTANWLDRHDEYRLIVHDWPDHAEQAVRKWLDRRHEKFLPCYAESPPRVRTVSGQSPDESQTNGSPREGAPALASAMASAVVDVGSFQDQEYSETRVPVKAQHSESDDSAWHKFMGVFLAAGKKLNERDVEKALRQWLSLGVADRLQALGSIEVLALERTAEFLPLPVNHLIDKPWTRRGPERMIPDPVRLNDKHEQAKQIFLADQRAKGRA